MPVMNEYLDLFSNDIKGVLPCTTKAPHDIRTGDALPIKKNPYPVLYSLREEMKYQLDEMMRKGVIPGGASPWAAPVIVLPKKSADGTSKYRFCTEFRCLNSVTSIPVYPIPISKVTSHSWLIVSTSKCWTYRMLTGTYSSKKKTKLSLVS